MLQLENISKSFPGVKVLSDVSLQFKSGEVHALCGENGAGKSTLMHIIIGNLPPDAGKIYWNEQPVQMTKILQAQKMGIAIVYQERSLTDSLSIAENIFPVRQPLTSFGLIDFHSLHQQAQQLLGELGLTNLSSKTLVSRLSTPQKQMVEIAKALAQRPSLLILDEPTASITHSETETLFTVIRQLKEKGTGIIYISHRMAEIERIADVISVLKDGKLQGTVDKNTPVEQVVSMMVGREVQRANYQSNAQNETKLEVKNICGDRFRNISFTLNKGEILGFAGLQGSGRTEMARAIFGDIEIIEGEILKNGEPFRPYHPSEAINAHVVYLPEERKAESLFLDKTVAENIFSAQLQKGFYNQAAVNNKSKTFCTQLAIRTPSVKQQVRKLSGGNQQKAVLAKWLATEPEILIVNEPTHGVDVGAKAEIYQLLKKLTSEGKSILLISSELPELLLLSDRIVVMYRGSIEAIINRSEASEERIVALASGIN